MRNQTVIPWVSSPRQAPGLPEVPVGSPVALGLAAVGPGRGAPRWARVAARQGALQGGGDDFGGEVEVVPEVLDALVGEVPVVVPPGELLLHIAARLQAGQRLDHLGKEVRTC